jgi:hypothetical protein
MTAWEKAKGDMFNFVKEMEKLIPNYSYSDSTDAANTDEKLCEIIVNRIRESKNKLFSVVQFLYESDVEERLDEDLQKLRDELDILSDEIKVRHCEWKVLSSGWIKHIIKHDIDLISETGRLNRTLEELLEQAFKLEKVKIDHIIQKDPEFWGKLESKAGEAKKQADGIAVLFKEREAVCSIESVGFEKAYEKIREDVRKEI